MGQRLCDGLCRSAKCAACSLQHRGMPIPLAAALGAVPPVLAHAARRLPGRLGTALSMVDVIEGNQARQAEMIHTVDRFVLLTAWALETAVANGAPRAKLALNRLGLSQSKIVPKPGPDEAPTSSPVTVGYLGRFEALKGVHDLARAARTLPAALPIRVELRGPVATMAERRCVAELQALVKHDPRVTFAPAVSHEAAADIIAGYDVLCCPSLAVEGGPTVAIEAHAVGTPVIGTRAGGLAELVSDGINGRLLHPGSWRELAAVLTDVAAAPAVTIDRWRRALPPARTMDQIATDYLGMYAG